MKEVETDPLVSALLDSLDLDENGDVDWGEQTDRLLSVLAERNRGKNIAEVLRDGASPDCDLDRLGFLFEIILQGFPGIDDDQAASTLGGWVRSTEEAEFRCAVSVQFILIHCDGDRESIEDALGEGLENAWPKYAERIRSIRHLWLAQIEGG